MLYTLPSTATDLVRIDLITEAGSAYQPQNLCAAAAARLHTAASVRRSAAEVAEWIDYRGVVLESSPDVLGCTVTAYALRKYCDELVPLLAELRTDPAFPREEFDIFRAQRKQKIQAAMQRSNEVARRLFYGALFGAEHPLGRYAVPEDADRLDPDIVRGFYRRHYLEGAQPAVVLSGNVDDGLIGLVAGCLGRRCDSPVARIDSLAGGLPTPVARLEEHIPGAVQTTLRVGRQLPLRWDSPDYARFMILTTALGGYFGSRLMSNLREDKGYTYGIYARTQIYRGTIVFYITADVAEGTADAAEKEIFHELHRLQEEPLSDDELQLVKTVLAGDFIRSVDGVFERAERLCSMLMTDVDEKLTRNMAEAIKKTTAVQLQELSQRLLDGSQMVVCRAGA